MLHALLFALAVQAGAPDTVPPEVAREFRGLWVATVDNLDWPSRPGLSTAEQQRELLALLDRAAALKLNAIVFQVRPEADALYRSEYEPWSRYLTGRQGKAPSPAWDPLAFAVAASHARGLELHAWLNPYRAAFRRNAPNAPAHVSRRHPGWIRPYYDYLWMDPGLPDVRRRLIRVAADVVRRYDIDGVHIDDYFYPYPEIDRSTNARIEFPDAKAYAAYRREGGTLDKADWRRRNVNTLIREFYTAVKKEKQWVKVGVSPFGIWRPANPPSIQAGIDTYDELFADSRKWLREGTLDYIAPQLYWPVQPPEQSYPVILQWWVDENVRGRHVWPGLALYKIPVVGRKHMSADDIIEEIRLTRRQPGATGHIHFNAKVLMENQDGIAEKLAVVYAEPALVPASPWLDTVAPPRPTVRIARDTAKGMATVHFAPRDKQLVAWWTLQCRVNGAWRTRILPGTARTHILKDDEAGADLIAVAAIDHAGNASPAAVLRSH
jgi:uncharacterized lipoprotein YddW (UPF0748 family)